MSKLKGIYYYFKDLVDINSEDYGKIEIVKADSDKDALNKLSIQHTKQYGKTNQAVETMYEFIEKRKID